MKEERLGDEEPLATKKANAENKKENKDENKDQDMRPNKAKPQQDKTEATATPAEIADTAMMKTDLH